MKPLFVFRSPGTAARGFTLIELMIAVVIVAILAAVAIPSFLDSLRKSRRSEAMTALTQLQQAQERWRSNNSAYTTNLASLGFSSSITPTGYYTISVVQAPGTPAVALTNAYVAMAYGRDGTSQANDALCRRVAVRLLGGNLTYAGCGSCSEFAATDFSITNACWAQ
jgi:type IV pilus assembly protein PilE